MNLRSLLLTTLVIFAAWWWIRAREQKEIAVQYAARRCQELSLKLLDQTVVMEKLRLTRDSKGRIRVLRLYQFDFTSTGEDRYQGHIELIGRQIISIHFPPHRVDQ